MKDKVLIYVELMKQVSGTDYRGEFETKVYGVMSEVGCNPKKVFFMADVHGLIGAIDASTILKPYISRGQIKILGAITFREYEITIERDPALKHRFSPIKVEKLGKKKTIDLRMTLSLIYETYHVLFYNFDTFASLLGLALKYQTTRR